MIESTVPNVSLFYKSLSIRTFTRV